MTSRHLISITLLSYLLFMLLLAPATLLKQAVTPHLMLEGLSGTLLAGRSSAAIAGDLQLEDTSWRFAPSSLLSGRLAFDVTTSYRGTTLSMNAGVDIFGRLSLRDIEALLIQDTLNNTVEIPVGILGGEVDVMLEALTLDRSSIHAAEGWIKWRNADITVAETATLGELSAMIKDDEGVVVTISNTPSDLEITGDIKISTDGEYDLRIDIKPTETASKNIIGSLQFIGKPEADGSVALKHTGNIFSMMMK